MAYPWDPCDCWFRERLALFAWSYPALGITDPNTVLENPKGAPFSVLLTGRAEFGERQLHVIIGILRNPLDDGTARTNLVPCPARVRCAASSRDLLRSPPA